MTALDAPTDSRTFDGPPGIAPRGTVLVLPGRGEGPGTYQRLGARLALDAYRVHVLPEPVPDPAATGAELSRALADADVVRPVVVLGSDTGALFAVAQLTAVDAPVDRVQGLVLAGLPEDGQPSRVGDWDAELDLRTSCPTHRARLTDGAVRPAALGEPVPAGWTVAADLTALDLPVLGLHGELDQVSPAAAARARYAAVEAAELVTVRGARHDVLNDQSHRSVAATVVLFLERLRAGDVGAPIVTVEAPRG